MKRCILLLLISISITSLFSQNKENKKYRTTIITKEEIEEYHWNLYLDDELSGMVFFSDGRMMLTTNERSSIPLSESHAYYLTDTIDSFFNIDRINNKQGCYLMLSGANSSKKYNTTQALELKIDKKGKFIKFEGKGYLSYFKAKISRSNIKTSINECIPHRDTTAAEDWYKINPSVINIDTLGYKFWTIQDLKNSQYHILGYFANNCIHWCGYTSFSKTVFVIKSSLFYLSNTPDEKFNYMNLNNREGCYLIEYYSKDKTRIYKITTDNKDVYLHDRQNAVIKLTPYIK